MNNLNNLPSDFMAEVLNGILVTSEPPSGTNWSFRLPELLLFIQRVLEGAKIEYNTTIVALILLSRLKQRLPKNAHGDYGTCHRLFLSAIVVATKNLTQGQSYPISMSQEESQLPAPGLLIENIDQPLIPPSPSSSSSDDSETQQDEATQDAINIILAEISNFPVSEVNAMERDLRKLLGQHIIVNESDVEKYVESNKYALGVC